MQGRFSVPFEPSPDWVEVLSERLESIHSLFFSLFLTRVPDARHQPRNVEAEEMAEGLARLPGPRKFALLNGRMQPVSGYRDPDLTATMATRLESLLEAGQIDGVVVADLFLLTALGREYPSLAACLSAQPSVNCAIDAPARLRAWLEAADGLGFRQPEKVVADRSLNRDPARLNRLREWMRRNLPEAELLLLANEGCLAECPFRATHEAMIASAESEGRVMACLDAVRDLGCLRRFHARPWTMLASPFIRPEDAAEALRRADGLKLCGRGQGAGFLARVMDAYAAGTYRGNLLELLDTLGELAPAWHVANERLPQDFARRLESCSGDCGDCGWCAVAFRRAARRVEPELRNFSFPDAKNTDLPL
ncbi:hypothetical protein [Desulfohalovibrio reitneri]|uniref:hypothetical protein n=1 Tax=Desulfohalovibrio reitneri TaxID=1307759 RepID=UPI00068D70DC|nr:hypothetical protein [Desulfohalovibrio reitneri]